MRTVFLSVACLVVVGGIAPVPRVPPPAETLTADQRLGLLKPVMSLGEVNQIWQGLRLHGQACGFMTTPRGFRGAFGNVYLVDLPGFDRPQAFRFNYIQGPDGYLTGFCGPGFRYELDDRDGKYHAKEGPPKR
jgi:hypothetical protein